MRVTLERTLVRIFRILRQVQCCQVHVLNTCLRWTETATGITVCCNYRDTIREARRLQVQKEARRCQCQFLATGPALSQPSKGQDHRVGVFRRFIWSQRSCQSVLPRSNNDFGTPATPALQAGAASFLKFCAGHCVLMPCTWLLLRPALAEAPSWDSASPAQELQWAAQHALVCDVASGLLCKPVRV